MVFGPILKCYKLPLIVPRALHGSGVNGARVGSWRGCLPRAQGLPVRSHLILSWWWSEMFVGGKEASWGIVIGWRFCPHWYMFMEYCIVKWVPTRRCFPPGKVMTLFRHVPQV
jgi:hypothetical protein